MKLLKKLFNWIWSNVQEVEPEPDETWVELPQHGFIDFETGRRVEIDPETRQKVFVD